MADIIELVIKINEDTYKAIQRRVANPKMMRDKVDIAIANGMPLPKGHGRLIDADELKKMMLIMGSNYIGITPTIIEADKESEDEE